MADAKISELPAKATVETTDNLVIVDNTPGTPVTKKITVATLDAHIVTIVGGAQNIGLILALG